MKLRELLNFNKDSVDLGESSQRQEPLRRAIKDASPGMESYKVLDNNSHPYMAYRFGVALASSPDNKSYAKGPIGSRFTIVDYTDADRKIRKSAEKAIGVKSSTLAGKKSQELPNTNKTSPVAKIKKNQYGI